METEITVSLQTIRNIARKLEEVIEKKLIIIALSLFMVMATFISYINGWIMLYGDAESHMNIAKRVIHGLTPGFAQLGGIWLPLPHIMVLPFVYNDFLWRSGLGGSIVSGISYVVTSYFLYKLLLLITKNKLSSLIGMFIFALNPSVLYLQSTPMTELPLLMFFTLSSYYFVKYLRDANNLSPLLLAAIFALGASLTRYDGWFLVVIEICSVFLFNLSKKYAWKKIEGNVIIFSTVALFGIFMWLTWDFLILGDPIYFSNSAFSAKSQQQGWLAKHQLPTYHNGFLSFAYYTVAAMNNSGVLMFTTAIVGLIAFLRQRKIQNYFIALLLSVPFIFYVITLYVGQSIIFIPHLTPLTFESILFNVRYGIMMIPFTAFFFSYLFYTRKLYGQIALIGLIVLQAGLYLSGYSRVLTLADGKVGLSAYKQVDAQHFLASNYDNGLVLLDDYSRLTSIVRTSIPMQSIIYIGTKPYWEESLVEPEKYAKWIIIQRGDEVWNRIYQDPATQGRLYKYFKKVYTSDDILIFKKNPV